MVRRGLLAIQTPFKKAWQWFRSLVLWQKIAVILLIIIALQHLVPSGLIAANTYLDGTKVGLQTKRQLHQDVEVQSSKITLSFGEKTTSVPASQAGVAVDVDKTVDALPSVTAIDRFIPLAPIFKLLQKSESRAIANMDDGQVQALAEKMAKTYTVAATDATANFDDEGNLVVVADKNGQEYSAPAIVDAIKQAKLYGKQAIEPKVTILEPAVTTESFQAAQATLDDVLEKDLTVTYGDKTKAYKPAEFKKWLQVVKQEDGSYGLTFKDDALNAQLTTWAAEYTIPAGVTQVTLTDGTETSRTTGPGGRKLNEEAVRNQLKAWVSKSSTEPVKLETQATSPRIVYTRIYSQSSAGLQAKINAWITSKGGKYQVAVQELNGQGRVASYNVSQQTVMASTYKLFLAYVAYKESENGSLNLHASFPGAPGGRTVQQCIELAIVNSSNECPTALGWHIGWAKVDQIIYDAGFRNVRLNNYNANRSFNGDKMVNAGELAKFLMQLSAGSLMNGTNTSTLLDYMKRQVYRQGIPAGSKGSVVADKVGFLDGYLHDAAIVYSPKSTYALVIMSSGSSWANISSLASAIHEFMNE
ncbi:MAG: serine hydrolase [Candidatus Saccharimonadales bacterium]